MGCFGHEEPRSLGQRVGALHLREVSLHRGRPPRDARDRPDERAPEGIASIFDPDGDERPGDRGAALVERRAVGEERLGELAVLEAKGALLAFAGVGADDAPVTREFDAAQACARRRPLEARPPVDLRRRDGRASHRDVQARAALSADRADPQARGAHQVQRFARDADLEERDFAVPEPCDPDALDMSPTELGLHLPRGAIAWGSLP